MNIGFIGLGNMASAIIKGMIASGEYQTTQICGYDPFAEAAQKIHESTGITICSSQEGVVSADVVVLAVKPQIIPPLLPELRKLDLGGKLIISIVGGVPLAVLEAGLGQSQPVIRAMPNINALVKAATSAWTANKNATDEHKKIVADILATNGTVMELPESLFTIFMAVASASPAFVYMYIDALARAGVKNGLSRKQALGIAASTVMGSAKMVFESPEHPCTLIDQVCSPGGTTIEGICALQRLGFETAVHQGIQAMIEKDRSLG